MREEFDKQKELLNMLITNLYDLKRYLIGDECANSDTCERKSPDCFMDEVKERTCALEYANKTMDSIRDVIIGGRK